MDTFFNKTVVEDYTKGTASPYWTVSDYVSKVDVEMLICLVNREWKWDETPDALLVPTVPRIRIRPDDHFVFLKEANLGEESWVPVSFQRGGPENNNIQVMPGPYWDYMYRAKRAKKMK